MYLNCIHILNKYKYLFLKYIFIIYYSNNCEHIQFIRNFSIYFEPKLSLFREFKRLYVLISAAIT